MPRESSFQTAAIAYIKSRGAYVVNNWGGPLTEKGRPDLFVCYRGYFIAFELKHPEMTFEQAQYAVAPAQRIHMQRIDQAGGLSCAANSAETIAGILDSIDVRIQINGQRL